MIFTTANLDSNILRLPNQLCGGYAVEAAVATQNRACSNPLPSREKSHEEFAYVTEIARRWLAIDDEIIRVIEIHRRTKNPFLMQTQSEKQPLSAV